MALSRPDIPIWRANTSARFPEVTARHARRPAAPRVCTGPLSPESYPQSAIPPPPPFAPNCTLLVRPIFAEATSGREHMPSATPKELAAAIIECIDAGARVINLSLALAQPSTKGEQSLEEALNQAVRRGVIVVAAAGNQGTIGSSAITRHPWVIPVVACDIRGRPMNESNLGSSIGRRGLRAPGDGITSLGAEGQSLTLGGTSVAVPFVTGATALLWSAFPSATAAHIKLAVTQASTPRRASVVPPLLDAAAAYQVLSTAKREAVNDMTDADHRNDSPDQSERPPSSSAPAWIHHGRGDRAWRCHQTGDLLCRDTALRRLRTPGGRAQPLDGVHPATSDVDEGLN